MTHEFTLILTDGKGDITDDYPAAERLYAAGCDDATIWQSNGVVGVHFDREAPTRGTAIRSAMAQIRQCGFECRLKKPELLPYGYGPLQALYQAANDLLILASKVATAPVYIVDIAAVDALRAAMLRAEVACDEGAKLAHVAQAAREMYGGCGRIVEEFTTPDNASGHWVMAWLYVPEAAKPVGDGEGEKD